MIAARITEPPVGASTCASGSQVCTGTIGTLTANAARNAKNSHICSVAFSGSCAQSANAKLPDFRYRYTRPISMNTEPRKVYRKNLTLA